MLEAKIINGDCTTTLKSLDSKVDLTFFDPPFNQNKHYNQHDDNLPNADYWAWMTTICQNIYDMTSDGGAIYFMQREKNVAKVLQVLEAANWTYQNLIIWKKLTSAVPSNQRFGKHFQVIVFATKGKKPRLFNKLRIDPPLPENYKYSRENGMYVTDIWDDIRELTSGYFAGDEAIRTEDGNRLHNQQAPIALLLRIILSSSQVGDVVLDPFAGTGTTCVVASQLKRNTIGIELDPINATCIQERLAKLRPSDTVTRFYKDYVHTENLTSIWGSDIQQQETSKRDDGFLDLPLFRQVNGD
jgi:site-specific DNA-methyltransferase (adenine-specific)